MKITKTYINNLAYEIVACAIEVHKEMGPGLLESVYEECLTLELLERGLEVKRQKKVELQYKDKKIDKNLYLDIIVNDLVIVELKSVDSFHPIHSAQIISYMNLSKKPKGLLINFKVNNIVKEGLIPFVNQYFSDLPE
ncbi:MAG: GxxExxY protein [Saprospiraceae bacterium]